MPMENGVAYIEDYEGRYTSKPSICDGTFISGGVDLAPQIGEFSLEMDSNG